LVVFFVYRNIMRDGRSAPASIATGHEREDIKKRDSLPGASPTPSIAAV
jgi:hypothetical protein